MKHCNKTVVDDAVTGVVGVKFGEYDYSFGGMIIHFILGGTIIHFWDSPGETHKGQHLLS